MNTKEAAKHTPGPWMVQMRRGSLGTRGHIAVLGPDFGSGHGDVVRTMGTTEREEANARLIAAAPELLAAVKEARTLLEMNNARRDMMTDRERALWNTIRAAVAKAEGC